MTTIILTSTVNVHNVTFLFQVNPQSRIDTYLKSIKKWLYETNLNIVLVENSGYTFEELNEEKEIFKSRFEIISFDETKLEEAEYLQQHQFGKGRHELFAINYAYKSSQLIKHSIFIIKITARYYIQEFENFLNDFELNNYDCLVQNNTSRCEVVGCNKKIFNVIFDINIDDEHVEAVWKHRISQYDNVIICKVFDIEATQMGGWDHMHTTI
jgi:hypothetical protein